MSIQLAGTLLHMCKRHGVLLDMCAEALHQIHGSSTGLWTNIATKTFIGSSCQMNHWTKATFWTRFNQDITKTAKPISCVSMMVELCHPCAHLSYTLWKMGGVGGGGWGYQCGSNLLMHAHRFNWDGIRPATPDEIGEDHLDIDLSCHTL